MLRKLALAALLACGLSACAAVPALAQAWTHLCVQIPNTASGAVAYSCQEVSSANPLPTSLALYPANANPLVASSGTVANLQAVATLPAAAGKTTYIAGFEITGGGATSGTTISPQVSNINGVGSAGAAGTLVYSLTIPTPNTVGITPLIVQFNPPLPATPQNTAISVTLPAFGSGNTSAAVVAHGFQF